MAAASIRGAIFILVVASGTVSCKARELGKTEAWLSVMDKEAFYRFTNQYYRSGSPDKANEVLKFFISSEWLGDSASVDQMAHFFSRIAENLPHVVRSYEALFKAALRWTSAAVHVDTLPEAV